MSINKAQTKSSYINKDFKKIYIPEYGEKKIYDLSMAFVDDTYSFLEYLDNDEYWKWYSKEEYNKAILEIIFENFVEKAKIDGKIDSGLFIKSKWLKEAWRLRLIDNIEDYRNIDKKEADELLGKFFQQNNDLEKRLYDLDCVNIDYFNYKYKKEYYDSLYGLIECKYGYIYFRI